MGRGTTIVGKVLLKQQAAKGTAVSSWSAEDAVFAKLFIPPRGAEVIAPEGFLGGFHQGPTIQGSKAGQDVVMEIPLPSLTDSPSAADPTPHHLALAMGDALGGLSTDGFQSDLTSGSDASNIHVTTGVEDHSGHAILVPQTGASYSYGIGWIKSHTTNVYGLVNALAGTPAASGTLYGSSVAYLDTAQPAKVWTLAHTLGVVGGTKYYDGTVIKASLVGSNGKPTAVKLTIRFPTWDPIAAASIAPYAYSHPMAPIIEGPVGGRFVVPEKNTGGTVGVAMSTLDITCEVEEEPDWSRPSGVSCYNVVDRKALWTIDVPIADVQDMYDVGDELDPLQADFCAIPGKAFGILMGAPIVVAQSPIQPLGKLIGQRIQVAPGIYTGDTETTAPAGTFLRTFFG